MKGEFPDHCYDLSVAELQAMAAKMRETISAIYWPMMRVGVHPFTEFNGLMSKYCDMCQLLAAQGIQFHDASVHTGMAIEVDDHHIHYFAEKLGCIFAPIIRGNPRARKIIMDALLGEG